MAPTRTDNLELAYKTTHRAETPGLIADNGPEGCLLNGGQPVPGAKSGALFGVIRPRDRVLARPIGVSMAPTRTGNLGSAFETGN